MTKRLAAFLLMLILLSFLCACDRTDQPDESVTHGSGVTDSQPAESETEATSGNETENEPETDTEEGSETEAVSGSETAASTDPSDDPVGSGEETTSPVVELPKVEFD